MRLRSALLIVATLAVSLPLAPPAAAHKGHAHASPSPAPAAPSPAPASSASSAAAPSAAPAAAAPSPAPATPSGTVRIDWHAALFEHMHNKIVHFPIALGLSAAVILLGGARWEAYRPVAAWLLTVAAVFGLAAYFTGGAQAQAFQGTPTWDLVGKHAVQGTLTALLLVAGAALSRVRAVQRWLWIYAIFLILAISFTGLLGGLIAHGEM
jgi:uncharacterized membrane protein